MIVELGHYCLILALVCAALQIALPAWGLARQDLSLQNVARPLAVAQGALIALAFFSLMKAYITSDFSVLNVLQNSHSAKPWFYKMAGTWGNHEGSMLLWTMIIGLFGAAFALQEKRLPFESKVRTLVVQGGLGFLFILFIVTASNPFLRAPIPLSEGQDLNPLLQDAGLIFHPPFLYLGYVGFSILLSMAVAALWEGRVDRLWASRARSWILIPWVALTIGIAWGAWWAYTELGWGGWWFWDPVENASLMPWLLATALLHSLMILQKRQALQKWAVLLSLLTFGLSLMGTFLVRSGLITSVHAFALDPTRGIFILGLLAIIVGGALFIYAARSHRLDQSAPYTLLSREGAVTINNLVLCTITATLLTGTLYPLLIELTKGPSVFVGPSYFNATVIPLFLPLTLILGAAPFLSWGKEKTLKMARPLFISINFSIVITGAFIFFEPPNFRATAADILAVCALIGGFWIISSTLVYAIKESPKGGLHWGMAISHMGVGIAVIGMAGSAWTTETIALLKPKDTLSIAGYELVFDTYDTIPGPNYLADRGHFSVRRGFVPKATLHPEKRWYPVTETITTEAAIYPRLMGNIYVTLGDAQANGQWVVRVWSHPFIVWIWIGAALMAIGGLVSWGKRASYPALWNKDGR